MTVLSNSIPGRSRPGHPSAKENTTMRKIYLGLTPMAFLALSACSQPEPPCETKIVQLKGGGVLVEPCVLPPNRPKELVERVALAPVGEDEPSDPDAPSPNQPNQPNQPDADSALGNPGNDKPVGRSGEKPDKDMDERSPAGNRGQSN